MVILSNLANRSALLLVAMLLLLSTTIVDVVAQNPQPTETCPPTITDDASCADACSGGTNNDPGAYNFVLLAESAGDAGDYVFTGFNCECEEADPPVFCTSAYTFPTCSEANVRSCTDSSCSDLCVSLGFGTDSDCSADPAIGCECEIVALVNGAQVRTLCCGGRVPSCL